MGIGIFAVVAAALFAVLGIVFIRRPSTGSVVGGALWFVLAGVVGFFGVVILVVGATLA